MRIISQGGTIDIPYEQVTIQRFGKDIFVLNKNLAGVLVTDIKIASYSTEAKANKVMLELIIFYTNSELHNRAFQFPDDKDVEVYEDDDT